jgi:hypothetical protein
MDFRGKRPGPKLSAATSHQSTTGCLPTLCQVLYKNKNDFTPAPQFSVLQRRLSVGSQLVRGRSRIQSQMTLIIQDPFPVGLWPPSIFSKKKMRVEDLGPISCSVNVSFLSLLD